MESLSERTEEEASAARCSEVLPSVSCVLCVGITVRLQERLQSLHRTDAGGGVDGGSPPGVGDVRVDAPCEQLAHLGRVARRPAGEVAQVAFFAGPLCMGEPNRQRDEYGTEQCEADSHRQRNRFLWSRPPGMLRSRA